ncbi:hypothetical protein BCR41DRAFT_370339 [Lobosporangium transversale]|uniref:Uncharacterized protein n=1 Tax=Lobosporangium transversale TaxID=64571 RepID=A0A1Y2GPB3_9FUNG|nr:hypothetical protein BCR41DRAFT_370339 [Lobosporangium transversale]ORZ17529.1 hypothetical protein BCR41DRAFT_370339 [Lobosporangium transversale]|eukprot:XP_021881916.1 hypothetical protein BCR41DRAFT_370339 [Lobosporangium transversale]
MAALPLCNPIPGSRGHYAWILRGQSTWPAFPRHGATVRLKEFVVRNTKFRICALNSRCLYSANDVGWCALVLSSNKTKHFMRFVDDRLDNANAVVRLVMELRKLLRWQAYNASIKQKVCLDQGRQIGAFVGLFAC